MSCGSWLGTLSHFVARPGWSQEQLAERAAMQRSYLADLERGSRNPSVRTLVKVANALGVPPSALVNEQPRAKHDRG